MSGESTGPGTSAIAAASSVRFATTSGRFPVSRPGWHHQQRPSPATRVASHIAKLGGRAVAGRGRKDGQAVGRIGDDRGLQLERQ
jgi:hypothetical protein